MKQVTSASDFAAFKIGMAALLVVVMLYPCSAYAAQHTITSLPYTCSTDYDTLTIAGTKVSGTAGGLTINANYVYCDFGTDTLEFGTGGGNGNRGLQFGYGNHDIHVSGGVILHGSSAGSTNYGIYFGSVHDVLIENTDVIVKGINGHCAGSGSVGAPGTYNVEISGGDYWNESHGYTSRCQYDGCAIRLSMNTYGGYGEYHYKIHDITIHTTPGQGIMVNGRDQSANAALVEIYNNNITCDARNDLYSYPSSTCLSSANAYGLSLLKCAPGSKAYNNTINSGTTYHGGRGILIENCAGAPGNPIEVYNNTVDVHEGPNAEYDEAFAVHGLRVRGIDGGYNRYLYIHDNNITVTADANSATDYMSSISMALRHSGSNSSPNITYERNIFRAKSLTAGVSAAAVVWDSSVGDSTLVFRNNRLESDGTLMHWGHANNRARNILCERNTFAFLSPTYDPQTFHVGYLSNDWMCTDNVVRDGSFENGASETDITFANGGTLELAMQRTITAKVIGSNGFPVPGASVSVRNNYNQTIISGVTNSWGEISGIVTYWYEQRVGTDSTAFNQFVMNAQMGSDTGSETFTVNHTFSTPMVTLLNTEGDTTAVDTTSPEFIEDLIIDPTAESGTIKLNWTAPGDDGDQGTASRYEIMWAADPASSLPWSADTILSNPKPAGALEVFILTDLPSFRPIHFGLQAFDEVNNSSGIAEIVALASGEEGEEGEEGDEGEEGGGEVMAATAVYAYPNPVSFRQGQHLTFVLSDTPVDLLIQTVAGETVLLAKNVSGDWVWRGHNAKGRTVAAGVYLWSADGPGDNNISGKIVIVP